MALGVPILTAEVSSNGYWVTLGLLCEDMTHATIYRVTVDGTQAVRGAFNVEAPGALIVADYEAPQNSPLTYFARVTDGVSTVDSALVSPTEMVNRGGDCFLDLSNPAVPIPITVVSFPSLATKGRRNVVEVIGRPDPVVVSDRRLYASGALTVATLSDDERVALNRLLAPGGIIAFSPRYPTYGFSDVWYLSVGDVSEDRISPLARHVERRFTLDVQRVSPPPADFLGPAIYTWGDGAEDYTWQSALTNGKTWFNVMVADE